MQKFYYLIHIQYLGFRYRGWLKQQDQPTIQKMVDKTIEFVLGHADFRTMGSSRTDSRVSANHTAFELFTKQKLDVDGFLKEFDQNLPTDIRALKMEEVEKSFNVIQASKTKEYLYLFAFGEKAHPFSASLISTQKENLDIDLMKEGARLFEGTHDFKPYIVKPSPGSETIRTIEHCSIEVNTIYTANFFPKTSYALRVVGKGFGRYQIRMMMGQLFALGRGEVSLDDIRESLSGKSTKLLKNIAPGSGLVLNGVAFDV